MVDPLSLKSVYIEVLYQEKKISSATGFIIDSPKDQRFLVTNWHVVTGRNAITKDILDKEKAAIPNKLKIWVQYKDSTSFEGSCFEIPLYKTSEINLDDKLWIEHPKGSKVDVVLIPLAELPNTICIFDQELLSSNLTLPLTIPVSLIGFPHGRTSFQKLPFWVTGFISSEPEVDSEKLFVNVPGRAGLSGSPVISRQFGGMPDARGNLLLDGRPKDKFVGIYSGRIHEESDIGTIWKPVVLNQILEEMKNLNFRKNAF